MSRFAVVYEDPEYDDDINWEDDEADWEDQQPVGPMGVTLTSRSIMEAVGEDEVYSPYYGA